MSTKQHRWIPSTLGHGEMMCADCFMTNREAWILGPVCEAKPKPPTATNNNVDGRPFDSGEAQS